LKLPDGEDSSPWVLLPQQVTLPSSAMAQEWVAPMASAVAVCPGVGLAWSWASLPQQVTVVSELTAHDVRPPVPIAV
jgi:hypothetical protein